MALSRHPLSAADPGLNIPLDEKLIRTLEQSFAMVMERCPDFTARFYARLFVQCPHLRGLFPADLGAQEQKLADTLAVVIMNLRDPGAVRARLEALGRSHRAMGVKPEHYLPVIAGIVGAMGEAAGEAWTSELRSDWTSALRLVSEAMMHAPDRPREPGAATR